MRGVLPGWRRDARGGLSGDGVLSTSVIGEHRVRVSMRRSAAVKFLDALACARVSPGQYTGRIEWTDDLLHIEIALHAGRRDDAREAALAAVQIFNNPNVTFKSETYAVLMVIAWTYLVQAFYRDKRVDYVPEPLPRRD